MKNRSVQKSLYPLEQMPFNEWLQYIKIEANRAEIESIERLNRKMKRQKIEKTLKRKRDKQMGGKNLLLSAKQILSN